MKKIYIPQGGGRDFWLRIPMNNESAGRHLCMDDVDENDMHVWLESGYGGCWTLVWEKDGAQRDGIAAKVPASFLGYGTYSVVMAGKFVNGDSFRTKRQLFIRLVDREDQADAEPTMYNEEQAYWAGPAVLSDMLSRDGLNTYELWILQGNEGTLEDYLSVSGLTLNDFMVRWNHLSVDVQSRIDRAEQTSINPKGDYDEEVEYHANDLVYDSETLSSYVSLLSHNTGNPVTDTTYWMKVLDGDDINQIKQDAEEEIDEALQDARTATTNAVSATTAAEAVVAQKVADAQIGYYECNTAAGTATKATTTNTIGQSTFAVPVKGCIVKVKMTNANTATDTVYLQFGSDANTKKELKYNGLAVDASNTWDAGEVISVYYDGTYYQASNAQGGSNRKIDAYLLGDLKTLAIGQTYEENEAVKTIDKQLLRVTKGVEAMNLTDEISIGDLKAITSGNDFGTYQAQKAVSAYNGTETDGLYAIGRPATASIVFAADTSSLQEAEEITVTINGIVCTASVDSSSDAASIATDIYNAFGTQEGWSLSDDGNGTLTLKSLIGVTTAPVITSSVGDSGVTVTPTSSAGAITLSQYNNGAWEGVTLADWAADSSTDDNTTMWKILSLNELPTKQNSVQGDVDNATIWYGEEDFDLATTTPTSSNATYIVASKTSNGLSWRIAKKDTSTGRTMSFNLPTLISGKHYTITFNYVNNLGTTPSLSVRDSSDTVVITSIGSVHSGSGIFKAEFTYTSNMAKILMYTLQNAVGLTLTFTDISIKETIHTVDVAPYASFVPGIYDDIHDVQEVTERVEDPVYDAWASSTQKRRYISYNCATHGRFTIKFTDNRFATQVIVSSAYNNINSSIAVMPGENYFEYANREYSFEWDDARVKYVVVYVKLRTDIRMTDAQIAAFKASMTVKIEDLDGYNGLDYRVNTLEGLVSSAQSFINSEKENENDYPNIYEGTKISVRRNTFACHTIGNNIFQSSIGDYTAAQGQVVYDDYCFRFHCAPQSSALNSGYCTVYNISNPNDVKFINGFVFETDTPVHCNAAQFAPNIEEGHDFPLCYMSGNYSSETYVIRFSLNDGIFSGEVIQHITFTTGGNNIIGEDGFLWGVSGSNGTLKAYKYPCPNPYIGDVSYTTDDLVDSFEVPIENIATWQGTMIYNNKIYMLFGTKEGANTVAKRCFMVVDTVNHTLDSVVNLNALITEEPEDIDIWKDKIVLGCNANCSYMLSFH